MERMVRVAGDVVVLRDRQPHGITEQGEVRRGARDGGVESVDRVSEDQRRSSALCLGQRREVADRGLAGRPIGLSLAAERPTPDQQGVGRRVLLPQDLPDRRTGGLADVQEDDDGPDGRLLPCSVRAHARRNAVMGTKDSSAPPLDFLPRLPEDEEAACRRDRDVGR